MAYNKKTWGSDEVITKEALNNIENGIEAVEQSIPKLVSQLTNDAGYITEHLDLSNYAEKDELHEHNNKDVLDGINLVRVQSWDNAASKNNTAHDCIITEEEKEEMNNRVKALEEVEHVSLEQYNTLLNRIALLEKALNDLKSENPEVPDEPDPDPEPEIPDSPVNVYSVTNNLTNVSTNNSITSIEEGQSYNATLTCGDDYDIYSVVVNMNGVDITNSVYDPEEPTT